MRRNYADAPCTYVPSAGQRTHLCQRNRPYAMVAFLRSPNFVCTCTFVYDTSEVLMTANIFSSPHRLRKVHINDCISHHRTVHWQLDCYQSPPRTRTQKKTSWPGETLCCSPLPPLGGTCCFIAGAVGVVLAIKSNCCVRYAAVQNISIPPPGRQGRTTGRVAAAAAAKTNQRSRKNQHEKNGGDPWAVSTGKEPRWHFALTLYSGRVLVSVQLRSKLFVLCSVLPQRSRGVTFELSAHLYTNLTLHM